MMRIIFNEFKYSKGGKIVIFISNLYGLLLGTTIGLCAIMIYDYFSKSRYFISDIKTLFLAIIISIIIFKILYREKEKYGDNHVTNYYHSLCYKYFDVFLDKWMKFNPEDVSEYYAEHGFALFMEANKLDIILSNVLVGVTNSIHFMLDIKTRYVCVIPLIIFAILINPICTIQFILAIGLMILYKALLLGDPKYFKNATWIIYFTECVISAYFVSKGIILYSSYLLHSFLLGIIIILLQKNVINEYFIQKEYGYMIDNYSQLKYNYEKGKPLYENIIKREDN